MGFIANLSKLSFDTVQVDASSATTTLGGFFKNLAAEASQATTALSKKSFTAAEGKDAAPILENVIAKYPDSTQKRDMETLLNKLATSGLSEDETSQFHKLLNDAPKPESTWSTTVSKKSFTAAEGKSDAPLLKRAVDRYPDSSQKTQMETLLGKLATSGWTVAETEQFHTLRNAAPQPPKDYVWNDGADQPHTKTTVGPTALSV